MPVLANNGGIAADPCGPRPGRPAAWVGPWQPDDLEWKMERRACEGPKAWFESHADGNPGINPVSSYSLVGRRIGRPMVSAVLH